MNKIIVIYEEYQEYNQFEGVWRQGWGEFSSLGRAQDWMDQAKKNSDYRKVDGPFILA